MSQKEMQVDENNIIQLKTPIKVNGVDVTQLTVIEPTVNDHIACSKITDPAMQDLTLFALMCGISPDDLRTLKFSDYIKIEKIYKSFLS